MFKYIFSTHYNHKIKKYGVNNEPQRRLIYFLLKNSVAL